MIKTIDHGTLEAPDSEAAPAAAPRAAVQASPPPPRVLRTIEEWAEAKGLIRPGWDADNRYISRHPSHRHFAPQAFNVAVFMQRWARGREISELDFDAAITAAGNIHLS